MEAAAMLPEDVVLEILVRVADATSLFRSAMACKRWLRLVVDPSFLRRRWPEDACDPSSLLGCFTTQHRYRFLGNYRHQFFSEPIFLPMPRRSTTTLGSFVPDGLLDGAAPLVARRGLILVRVGARADQATRCDDVLNLAVYNLFAGTRHVLPPLRCDSFSDGVDTKGYAILTGADACPDGQLRRPADQQSHLSFFKVLIIGQGKRNSNKYNLHTFSSSRSGWSTATTCFSPQERHCLVRRDAVVSRGTAHWLFSRSPCYYYCALGVDIETGNVTSLTKLPAPLGSMVHGPLCDKPILRATADGTLSSCCLYRPRHRLEIWTRQDHGQAGAAGAGWLRPRVIHLKLPKHKVDGQTTETGVVLHLCWGEKSGTLLTLDSAGKLYVQDVETGAMVEVMNQHHGVTFSYLEEAMAIEMDWPALFLSRLGYLTLYHNS